MDGRQLGEMTIARVLEFAAPDFPPLDFFPDTVEEDWAPHRAWLQPRAMDPATGNLIFPMQSYLVRTPHHNILIDTCVGNHKERPWRETWHQRSDTTYMDGLARHGLTPDDIDFVMCTHMHGDHIGWNTKLVDGRWVPTFPNARYVFSKKEYDSWNTNEEADRHGPFADSVLPIVEAGRAELVTNDYALDDTVWLEPTPGHTPDHVAIRLASSGANAVMSGDLMHSPIQCKFPEWRAKPDSFPDQAKQTRRGFLDRYCETDVLVCTAHFPLPSCGHVIRDGDAFGFRYEDATY